jgi:drug/metabolite transporter (DMT)-like permease
VSAKSRGVAYLVATVLLFSTYEVTSKLLGPGMGPLSISLWRFLIGGLALLPFAIADLRSPGAPSLGAKALLCIAGLGFLNIVLSMGMIQLALTMTPASVTAIIFSSNPLFVAPLAALFLRERLNGRVFVALALGLAGTGMLFLGKPLPGVNGALGPLLTLGSGFLFALYSVLTKRFMAKSGLGSVVVTPLSFIMGSVLLLPIFPLFGQAILFPAPMYLPALAWMSVMVTGVAYLLYFKGLELLPASSGTLVYFAKPPLATLLAFFALGESLGWQHAASIALVALGIALANFGGRKKGTGA